VLSIPKRVFWSAPGLDNNLSAVPAEVLLSMRAFVPAFEYMSGHVVVKDTAKRLALHPDLAHGQHATSWEVAIIRWKYRFRESLGSHCTGR
jgi:hypothetical protein